MAACGHRLHSGVAQQRRSADPGSRDARNVCYRITSLMMRRTPLGPYSTPIFSPGRDGGACYERGTLVPSTAQARRYRAVWLHVVASAKRHALHPCGACLAGRLCRGSKVQGLGFAVWRLGLKVGRCVLRARVLGFGVQGSGFRI